MNATPKSKDDLKMGLPNTNTSVSIDGLDATIRIYRDDYGIPHVKASTVHDVFFGQGFATAQDRLWHMDYDRRRAYGRWSEYTGAESLAEDIQMRKFQILPSVKADYGAVDSDTVAMLNAYAEGVNSFIQNTKTLPVEYALVGNTPERWQPWDCLAVYKARHILMGGFDVKLWRGRLVNQLGVQQASELLRRDSKKDLIIVPPGAQQDGISTGPLPIFSTAAKHLSMLGDGDSGSNNWAVHGNRTASGKPLLAGDPHRSLDTPNVYYQNHIACPEFNTIGLSFPGFPGFPHFAHNDYVAWCITHAAADYQDIYIEQFNQDNPTQYKFKGEWLKADIRREKIVVKGSTPVEIDVTVTHHGPIIISEPESGYGGAFKYSATSEPNLGSQSILQMLKSTNVNEHDESMRNWTDPCNNFVFVDIHGDISYLTRGKIPIRSEANAWMPVPGWTGDHEWAGTIPFEEMPRIRNPETGYIVTANNRIIGDDYPHYIGLFFSADFRARRITERLKKMTAATVSDMQSVHADRISIPAHAYISLLSHIRPTGNLTLKAKEMLMQWDGAMERDSAEAAIYSEMRLNLDRPILRHLLGPLFDEAEKATGRGAPFHVGHLRSMIVDMIIEGNTDWLPPKTTWRSLLSEALENAVESLANQLGTDIKTWTWGAIHGTNPTHTLSSSVPELAQILDPPSVSMSGDGDTPQSASYSLGDPYTVTGTSVARYVFDASNWSNSRWVVPLGASGHPGSDHYADQTPIWSQGDLIPMLWEWGTLEGMEVQELQAT